MTGRGYERQLTSALSALEVVSSHEFAWHGEITGLPDGVIRQAAPELRRSALVDAIRWRLYASFFTAGRPVRPVRRPPARDGRRSLSHTLAAANSGRGCVDPGWRVVGRDAGRWVVERSRVRLWPDDHEIVGTDTGRLRGGEVVCIRLGRDAPELSPGYYTALGDAALSADVPRKLDRFYFNLREDGAVEFVRQATAHLNARGLGFRLKVVDEPGGFDRCDSGILGFERRDRERAVSAVLDLRSRLAAVLDAGTPALTLPLAHGLGFAEDPGEESFGTQRCRLIAEALVECHQRSITDPAGRVAAVADRFERAGTSLSAPYRGPNADPGLRDLTAEAARRG